ncbi:transposase [Luteibacter sp. UNC138MFCol5.1]|uniref:REP-associated tyrosine transposase n=1 Tax=Luteibacter sp. UNC138MFCol5.1 TaxID=1502774 RepID=UPI0031B57E04
MTGAKGRRGRGRPHMMFRAQPTSQHREWPALDAKHIRHPVPMPIRPGTAVLRRGRSSIPGHAYLLTTATRDRTPLFQDTEVARAVSRVVHDPTTWSDATLLAWVLMPDHWHGLLELGCTSLPECMSRFKACSARATGRGSIWQSGYHDSAVRSGASLIEAARYIVANPVRAGLVRRALDYPYWNAVWL